MRIFRNKKPIVAAVHGAAIGGGFGLAVSADFRVTCPEARFAANFTKLGLTDADVETVDQVADVLAEHFALLQRPIIVRDGRAIVGRPKDRVAPFLS